MLISAHTVLRYIWNDEVVPYGLIKHIPKTGVLRIVKLGTIIIIRGQNV